MEFGIFDHCERNSRSPTETYQERFRVARRAEKAGFFAYHVAEHHGTPLSLVPSPSVFLAALAQATTTLRLGPLVYLLPLYNPYRVAEEVCMLDDLSGGRIELGVGRGANPIELSFFGLDPASAQARFKEAFDALMQGLLQGRISLQGDHYQVKDSPVDGRTLQRPHPPIWYPSSGGGGSLAWAAQQGYNTVVNGSLSACAEAVKVFKDNFAPGDQGADPKVGLTRYVYIGDTDAEAMRVGQEAFRYHMANLTKLTREAGLDHRKSPVMPPDDFDEAIRTGWAAVGSPATVCEQLASIFDKIGNNYFIFAPMQGDLSVEWGLNTIAAFEDEVMPAFGKPRAERKIAEAVG